ncbi:hypothetical protein N7481_002115 [Penicillium waksmanii]|uniref:uncharacterized protein n=1 Tax=Penicillium waksmanii TaxID=69791 RepID=UPI0025477C6A|nr:uncharacterized protein N7481_002115 [Penicillium waksmanii]KAJ5995138.1 hypothetical protein N7481_002115 [Penicillium waksmanii]
MKTSMIQVLLAFATVALAGQPGEPCDTCDKETGKVCASGQSVVCKGEGTGLITLGNVLPGALGKSCAGGDVYCCSHEAASQGNLLNLDVNAQCSLNHVL